MAKDAMASSESAPAAVLGAGSWGTALALLLSQHGEVVRLWDRTPTQIDSLIDEGENRRYLPGIALPPSIFPTHEIAAALSGAVCVVLAVPSSAIAETLTRARPHISPDATVVLAAKGLEPMTGRLPSEVARAALEPGRPDIVALSGPNLAREIARGIPAAAVAACPDAHAARWTAARFTGPAFRVYTSSDRTGVELGGAVKNVLAIAGGVSDGLGFGDNTKATLLTRGLAEMTRLGIACGARAETFYGLAGVGDLMATAASRLSRNYRVGEALARGEALNDVLSHLGQVAEGVETARAVGVLADAVGVEMPVCRAVAALLFENLSPADAVAALLNRAPGSEGGEGGG